MHICSYCNTKQKRIWNRKSFMLAVLKSDKGFSYAIFLHTKLADPKKPLHVKRKLLQEVQVGKGVMSDIETIY